MQAVFLIELLSQFRGKRASNSLSATFKGMFRSVSDSGPHLQHTQENPSEISHQ